MDVPNILAEEIQSIVTVKCFLIHQRPMIRLGIPAVRVVTIRPTIPNFGISRRLSGSPIAEVSRVSFRVNRVFP